MKLLRAGRPRSRVGFLDRVTPTGQEWKHFGASCQHLSRALSETPLFHSRMIRPVVGGGGPTYLKQIQKERPGNGSQVIVRSGFKAIIQPVVLCAGRSSC